MASRPKQARLERYMYKLAVAEFGEAGPDGFPIDYLTWPLARIASGVTITALAAQLASAEQMNESVSRVWLSGVLQRGPRDGRARVRAARIEAAAVLAEECVAIADRPISTTAEASQARLAVDTRKWLAGVMDRDAYGDKPHVQVNISNGQLHLDALRSRAVMTAKIPRLLAEPTADYEVMDGNS